MQNSGLSNAQNPLLSLCDPDIYSIPLILLIGWRGEPGVKDAVQHVKDGRIQLELLEVLEIPYEIFSKNDKDFKTKILKGIQVALKKNCPFAFLIKKETFECSSLKEKVSKDKGDLMLREEALEIIIEKLKEDCTLICTTGKTSRELYEIRERNKQAHFSDFLTVGSMGHCSSIALGVAIAKPEKNVICIDGDGSLIMHMGSLVTIGNMKLKNYIHILLNNKVHESVGGQPTGAEYLDFPSLVKSLGYKNVISVKNKNELIFQMDQFIFNQGPGFMEIHIKPGSRDDLGRPDLKPVENKKIFMSFLKDK